MFATILYFHLNCNLHTFEFQSGYIFENSALVMPEVFICVLLKVDFGCCRVFGSFSLVALTWSRVLAGCNSRSTLLLNWLVLLIFFLTCVFHFLIFWIEFYFFISISVFRYLSSFSVLFSLHRNLSLLGFVFLTFLWLILYSFSCAFSTSHFSLLVVSFLRIYLSYTLFL